MVQSNTVSVTVATGLTGPYYITGFVTDAATGAPIANALATTQAAGVTLYRRTNAQGKFTFGGLNDGTYTVDVSASGYLSQEDSVTVKDASVFGLQFPLLAG